MKLTLSGRRNGCVSMPESACPCVCLTTVSPKRSMWTSSGAITLKAIVAFPPVTVTVCAVSGAVRVTVWPVVLDRVPAVLDHVVFPGECVSFTSSPTPTSVRVRAPGAVATVSLVIDSDGAGAGPGGVGAGPGGAGDGPGGAGDGPGGAGDGAGGAGDGAGGAGVGAGAGAGAGLAKSRSSAPIVSGPTIPSGSNPCDRWKSRTAPWVSALNRPSTPNFGSGKPASMS